MNDTTGDRIRNVRKRRGLTQKELARLCGLSVSWVKQQEQGTGGTPAIETLHRVAVILTVPTTSLVTSVHPAGAHPQTAEEWTEVRDALYGRGPEPSADATATGVLEVLAAARPALAANRYAQVRAVLPGLIRDAETLDGEDRGARSRVLNLTAWLLTQTRQWDDAAAAATMARDAARETWLNEAAAVNTLCWSLLRQGELTAARDLATARADVLEPRFSSATTRELALWGPLLLGVTNAAVRDNRPGEAEDALSLAAAAAERIGREVSADGSTTRTFGPATVKMIAAENAAITRHPDKVMAIAAAVPPSALHPLSASRCRHRLDVAGACVMLHRYTEAMGMLQELLRDAPEWLVQQRYARLILADITAQRRTLTREMRDLADAIRLPL